MTLGSPIFSTSRVLIGQVAVFIQWENESALENATLYTKTTSNTIRIMLKSRTMKIHKILLLAISLICMFGCTKDEFDEMLSEPENFRLIKVLNYSSSSASEPTTFMNLKYYANGNLQKESIYDYPNTLFTYRVYDYDNNNLLKEKKVYDGQVGNLTLGTYTKYEYESGNLIKEELYLANGTLKRTKFYEYENDNLINTYKVDDKLGIHHQYKYSYNDLNVLILEEVFMYNQEMSSFTKYSYDNDLRLTKTEIFDHNETITQTVEHKYSGEDTLPSEEIYYDSHGNLTQRRQLLYDSFDNLTETKIITDQGTNTLFKKKFNGKLLIEHIRYAPTWGYSEWGVSRYEYEKIN